MQRFLLVAVLVATAALSCVAQDQYQDRYALQNQYQLPSRYPVEEPAPVSPEDRHIIKYITVHKIKPVVFKPIKFKVKPIKAYGVPVKGVYGVPVPVHHHHHVSHHHFGGGIGDFAFADYGGFF